MDLEDGPGRVVRRLLDLGVPRGTIARAFHYLAPTERLTDAERRNLTPLMARMTLVVIDACTEALALEGLSSNVDTDVATWYRTWPHWAAQLGPAVLVIDHVVKNVLLRGRWSGGTGHKLACLDGSAFTLERTEPFGRGRVGGSRLWVSKDRDGQVRGPATVSLTGQREYAGDLVIDSTAETVKVLLHAPRADGRGPVISMSLRPQLIALLTNAPGPLRSGELEDQVGGRPATVRAALSALVQDGHVVVTPGPGNSKLHSIGRPYDSREGGGLAGGKPPGGPVPVSVPV